METAQYTSMSTALGGGTSVSFGIALMLKQCFPVGQRDLQRGLEVLFACSANRCVFSVFGVLLPLQSYCKARPKWTMVCFDLRNLCYESDTADGTAK